MAVNAPRNLTATVASSTEIDLAWAQCDSPARQVVHVRSLSIGGQAAQYNVTGATTSYAATGLLPGTSYEFYVVAVGSDNSVAESERVIATTDAAPSVTAPSGLSLGTINYVSNALSFSFTDNSTNEQGFEIELTDQSTGDIFIQQLTAHSGTGTVSGQTTVGPLSPGRLYRGRVRATHATIGNSAWSDYTTGGTSLNRVDSAGTAFPARQPRQPFNFVGIVNSESRVTLTWDSTDTYSSGFYIDTYLFAPYHLIARQQVALETRALTITGLLSNTTYEFACRCFGPDGTEASAGYRVRLTTSPPPPPIPSAPTGASAAGKSTSSARVKGHNTSIHTEIIKVYRTGVSPSVARALAGTISPFDIETEGYLDTGLTGGNSYKWDLVASNISGDSAASDFSNTVLITVPVEGLPDPQSIEAAPLGPDAIFVQWIIGTASYSQAVLEWSDADTGPWTSLIADIPDGTIYYVHTGLDADTEYFYRLTLIDATAGETYAIASATTDPGVASAPTGPTILRAVPVGSTRSRLEWVPTDSNVHAYDVYRGSHGGALSTIATDLSTTTRHYDDSGLTANTAYDYKVRAKSTAGSGDSSIATVTTLGGAGGLGVFGSHQGSTQYARSFNKDTPDLTVVATTDVAHMVEYFRANAVDGTDGPFCDLLVDGTSIAPRDPTGLATVRNFIVAAGSTITMEFSGVDTGTANMVLRIRRL